MKSLRSLDFTWLFPCLLILILSTLQWSEGGLEVEGNTIDDTDTLMRLAYLRQVMETHSWQGGFFPRDNAPYGFYLHWTLPFNLIVLGMARMFQVFHAPDPLQYAGFFTGPLLKLVLTLSTYLVGRIFLSREIAVVASLAVGLSAYCDNYGYPGSANHHIFLCLFVTWMIGAVVCLERNADRCRAAVMIGLLAGLGMWSSFELIIVAVPALAFPVFLWVTEGSPSRFRQLLVATALFSIIMDCALIIDPPFGGYADVKFDHISAPFQVLASIPLMLCLIAGVVTPQTERGRGIMVAAGGAMLGLAWLALYPAAIHGVEGQMDPYVRREWFAVIKEVGPLDKPSAVLAILGNAILALALWDRRGNRYDIPVLIGMLGLTILSFLHYRFGGYSWIVGSFYVAWYVQKRMDEFPVSKRRGKVFIAIEVPLFCALIVFGFTLLGYEAIRWGADPVSHAAEDNAASESCSVYDISEALDDHRWLGVGNTDPIIASEIDLTPQVLYWTGDRTLAGNYHRDSQGIKDLFLLFRDIGSDTAGRIVRQRGIDFVLLCAQPIGKIFGYTSLESARARHDDHDNRFENTLYNRLLLRKPPDWLVYKPWPEGTDSSLLLYKVDRARLESGLKSSLK